MLLRGSERLDYIVTPIATVFIAITVLELWHVDLSVPLYYGSDALVFASWIKGIVETGWWLNNQSLGAPFSQMLHDFPYPGTALLQVVVLKIIGALTNDHWLAHNLYYILTFPLIALTALFSLRNLGISRYLSISASILFAFSPYHLFHGTIHLFTSGYYSVPLTVLIAVWVFKERRLFFRGSDESKSKYIMALCFAALLAISDIHYAFFGCFLILVAGFSGGVAKKSYEPAANAVIVVALISTIVVASLVPTILYHHEFGPNLSAAKRTSAEADVYGLKIAQLLLPAKEHRVPVLAELTDKYYLDTGILNETSYVTLGVLGSLGFLLALLWLFLGRFIPVTDDATRESLDVLSILNGAALSLGTVGGFGMLFALLISPQIRVYNRISIFIAFTSLAVICIVADRFVRRMSADRKGKAWLVFPITIFTLLGILDQSPQKSLDDYQTTVKEFNNDRDFISRIEETTSRNSMIFQLPWTPFPENGDLLKMTDYQHMKGYLHSQQLRWSYGAVKGREAARWQNRVAGKPIPDLLQDLTLAGFNGVYVDRYGYSDDGASVVAEISQTADSEPIEDGSKRYVFFPLQKYQQAMIAKYGNSELLKMRTRAMNTVYVEWQEGCYDIEKDATRDWRWCSANSTIAITNDREIAQEVAITMTLVTNSERASKVRILSELLNRTLSVSNRGTPLAVTLLVPPGKHEVRFSTDAEKVVAPTDTRDMYFYIENFRIR